MRCVRVCVLRVLRDKRDLCLSVSCLALPRVRVPRVTFQPSVSFTPFTGLRSNRFGDLRA